MILTVKLLKQHSQMLLNFFLHLKCSPHFPSNNHKQTVFSVKLLWKYILLLYFITYIVYYYEIIFHCSACIDKHMCERVMK